MVYTLGSSEVVVGIDLGTTNTVCCVYDGREFQILSFDDATVIPSYVQYKNGDIICGKAAKNAFKRRNTFVVSNAKRIIGRLYEKREVANLQALCGVEIKADDRTPKFVVSREGKMVSATEVGAELIKYILKEIEKKYPGKRIGRVMITTPAYFDENQKSCTIQAGVQAGINRSNIDTLNEPTAASICYGLENDIEDSLVLVYDFGGGTFDVSILHIQNGNYTVVGTGGKNDLGGVDVDKAVMELIKEEYKKTYHTELFSTIKPAMLPAYNRQLQRVAEEAKIALEFEDEYEIDVTEFDHVMSGRLEDGDIDDDYCKLHISIRMLNNKIKDIIQRTIDETIQVMADCGVTKYDISNVALVGGSSHLRIVYDKLKDIFGDAKLKQNINCSECVAKGAAMSIVRKVVTVEKTNYSLGTSIFGNRVVWMITKGQTLPAQHSDTFVSCRDYQDILKGEVMEGSATSYGTENINSDMIALTPYAYSGFSILPAGQCTVKETYTLEKNGLLYIDAEEIRPNPHRILDHYEVVYTE